MGTSERYSYSKVKIYSPGCTSTNKNVWKNPPTISIVSSGIKAGGRVPPRDFWPGNFCWPTGKKEARKKGKRGENGEEKKENCKKEGGKLKEEGKLQNEERTFFFFFFFAFHFSKPLKFVLGLPKWKFSTGKCISRWEKWSGKMTLPPQKNFPVMPLIVRSLWDKHSFSYLSYSFIAHISFITIIIKIINQNDKLHNLYVTVDQAPDYISWIIGKWYTRKLKGGICCGGHLAVTYGGELLYLQMFL